MTKKLYVVPLTEVPHSRQIVAQIKLDKKSKFDLRGARTLHKQIFSFFVADEIYTKMRLEGKFFFFDLDDEEVCACGYVFMNTCCHIIHSLSFIYIPILLRFRV